jgi:hypothetical protein
MDDRQRDLALSDHVNLFSAETFRYERPATLAGA